MEGSFNWDIIQLIQFMKKDTFHIMTQIQNLKAQDQKATI